MVSLVWFEVLLACIAVGVAARGIVYMTNASARKQTLRQNAVSTLEYAAIAVIIAAVIALIRNHPAEQTVDVDMLAAIDQRPAPAMVDVLDRRNLKPI